MREATIARNYAEALLELGERNGEVDAYARSLDDLASLIERTPALRAFLETPKISAAQKRDVLRQAFAGRASTNFVNFLQIVVDKRRQGLLTEIAREYHTLVDQKHGRLHVDVTLAHAPDAEAERALTAQLSQALGKTVIPKVRVNPEILGGVIVRYGDKVMDGSIRRQLTTMRNRMLSAEMPRA